MCIGSNPSSSTYWLCDTEQVIRPFCASVFSSVTGEGEHIYLMGDGRVRWVNTWKALSTIPGTWDVLSKCKLKLFAIIILCPTTPGNKSSHLLCWHSLMALLCMTTPKSYLQRIMPCARNTEESYQGMLGKATQHSENMRHKTSSSVEKVTWKVMLM